MMISATALGEAIEMARRSKMKRSRLYWLRRMETLSKLRVSSESLEEAFEQMPKDFKGTASSWAPHSRVDERRQGRAAEPQRLRAVLVEAVRRRQGGPAAEEPEDPGHRQRAARGLSSPYRHIRMILYVMILLLIIYNMMIL